MTTPSPLSTRPARRSPPASLIRRILRRLIRLFYQKSEMVWLALDLDQLQPRYTLRQRSQRVELLGKSNAAAFQHFRDKEYPYKDGTRILNDVELPGFRCFLAMQDGNVIGVMLMGTADYHYQEPKVYVRIPAGDACVYGIWIAPGRQRKMIAGPLVETALLYYKERDFRRATGFTDRTNHASLRVTARFGFQEKNAVRFHRVLSRQLRPNRESGCDL